MDDQRNMLVLIDGVVNLVLGIALLAYPAGLAELLALPPFTSGFYPTLLGALLLGIGLALFIEHYGKPRGLSGLGVAGAMAVNACGGAVLVLWLTVGNLMIPLKGRIVLWMVAGVVLILGVAEAASGCWRGREDSPC